MDITSPDNFLHELNTFSSRSVRNLDDLRRLLEAVIENSMWKQFEEVSFSAKYLNGLMKIIRKKDSLTDEDYFAKIKTELTDGIKIFHEKVTPIVDNTPEFYQTIFDEKFFAMTQGSFANLNGLIEDFSLVKKYLNSKKYGQAARS